MSFFAPSTSYNALNWRIVTTSDTTFNGTLDERRFLFYSAAWRLVEERIDSDTSLIDDPQDADIDTHIQYVWGLTYIDDCILHRIDDDPDQEDGYEDTFYHLWDVQYSTVAIIDDLAALKERIEYDAYGNPRHHRLGDINGDRAVNGLDTTAVLADWGAIDTGGYSADSDINRDGVVNVLDLLIVNGNYGAAEPEGVLSHASIGNSVGFSGYLYTGPTQTYCVRMRWFDTKLGRWIERDPLGYADSMNLYQYGTGTPIGALDPFGLVGIKEDVYRGDPGDMYRRYGIDPNQAPLQRPWWESPWVFMNGVKGYFLGLWDGLVMLADNLTLNLVPGLHSYADRLRATGGLLYRIGDWSSFVGLLLLPFAIIRAGGIIVFGVQILRISYPTVRAGQVAAPTLRILSVARGRFAIEAHRFVPFWLRWLIPHAGKLPWWWFYPHWHVRLWGLSKWHMPTVIFEYWIYQHVKDIFGFACDNEDAEE